MKISIAEAKARFSELVKRAQAGEEIVVTRHGRRVARVTPPAVEDELPRIGALQGKIRIADDFDAPLDAFAEYRR